MLAEPGYWVELLLALALGTVGAVFITTARQILRRRGLWPWLAGLAVSVVLIAALVVLLFTADYGYWFIGVVAMVIVGRWPAVPLRRWVLREDGPRVEPAPATRS